MFERFTERARQIVVLAQEEARKFESDEIGVEHILLACYTEEEGAAARVLRQLKVSESDLRDMIPFGTAGKQKDKQLPFTKEAKGVLELALREALSLGHNYIGTEHILLGILRDQPAVIRRVVDPQTLRDEMMRFLTWNGPSKKTTTEPEPVAVSFEIKPGQYWTDDNRVTWEVVSASENVVRLERVEAQTLPPRDLVRTHRLASR